MSRWFRFHDEALDDPKVQRLAPDLFKFWVNILCLASKRGGELPDVDDIGFALRMSADEAAQKMAGLIVAGLVDEEGNNSWQPHNWGERQFKSDVSTDRVKRFRKRSETVSETPPEAETEPDTEVVAATREGWNDLETKLRDAAGHSVNPTSPSLMNLSVPLGWLRDGADLEMDILPVIGATARRPRRSQITSWAYFSQAVADAKANRLAPLPRGQPSQARRSGNGMIDALQRMKQHEPDQSQARIAGRVG